MKKNLYIVGLFYALLGLLAISWPGSPIQLVSISRVTPAPAQPAPTLPPLPTSAAPFTPTPLPPTSTPQPPTRTPVPTAVPNPYLAILQPLADNGKTWVQLDGSIDEGVPVLLVDLRKYDGKYTQALSISTPACRGLWTGT